jgi:hypothetical protein
MAFEKAPAIKVSPLTYRELTAVKNELAAAKQRQVTYSEAIDELVHRYRAPAELLRDVKEAGR